MKNLLSVLFLTITLSVSAQVAITTDGSSPDNSAMPEVQSTTKGMLIPRMTFAQGNSIAKPATWLTIVQPGNTPGFYFNAAIAIAPVWMQIGSGSGWSLTGNSGTNPATNFIGNHLRYNLVPELAG
ncbi:MAG: hypothetical protein WCI71_18240 [Bacteroidota bacterium]